MKKHRSNLDPKEMAPGITAWVHHDIPQNGVVEVEFEPQAVEPMHYHEKANQLFFVKKGKVKFTVDGEDIHLQEGDSIYIQAGKHHMAQNTDSGKIVILVNSQPTATGDRILVE